jgi:phage terminase Nu1 subunit (DNA packaging protein)
LVVFEEYDIRLSRVELARAFGVSSNTIGAWFMQGCPRISAGGPGVPSDFYWEDVAYWVHMYKIGPGYSDPDVWIKTAYRRARALVAARKKRKSHG